MRPQIFMCKSGREPVQRCCWWWCCEGLCSRQGTGDALCFFLSHLLSPQFLKRCPSSPQSTYPLEDVHSITGMTHKMSRCLLCVFSLFFLMSENGNVTSSKLDPRVHRDTAQSLLISYGPGKWIFHWTERGFWTKVPGLYLSTFILLSHPLQCS